VPNYNNGRYLAECLDSILGQTYEEIEVIVADDASTDDSVSVIKSYCAKYPDKVKGLFSDKNLGVAANRDRAIRQAKGEYISTLDADDIYYNPEKIATEIALIKRHKQERQVDICAFSNTVLLDQELCFIRERGTRRNIKQGRILEYIISKSCEIPLDFVMPKQAYLSVGGYDTELRLLEDWDLNIRLAAQYDFCYTGITGTGYRQHNQGLSKVSENRRLEKLSYVFNKNLTLVAPERQSWVKRKFKLFRKRVRSGHRIRQLLQELEDARKTGKHVSVLYEWKLLQIYLLKIGKRLFYQ